MHSRVHLQGRLVLHRLSPQLLSVHVSTSGYATASQHSGGGGKRDKNSDSHNKREKRKAKTIDVQSLLEELRETESTTKTSNLRDVLAGIKFHVPTNEVARRKLGMPSRSSYLTRPEKEVPRLKSSRVAENSMYPSAGPRLGVFNIPTPDTNLMPPAPPNVAEREYAELVATMKYLKPTNHFESEMTDVTYPRQFPVDNESANDDEIGVGFEEHVLLNHLLKGFPSRGPVRHFMEMVVTGLSKNPHYTAREKREYVQWYRDYFAQFSDEELQALPSSLKRDTE